MNNNKSVLSHVWTTRHRAEVARLLPLLYSRLLNHFGPRGWWPGETREEVIIGAVLTQNTAWTNVERALADLRREIPITLRAVAEMAPGRLAERIRPVGYFTLKTKRLQAVARWFVERCGTRETVVGHGGGRGQRSGGRLRRVPHGSADSAEETAHSTGKGGKAIGEVDGIGKSGVTREPGMPGLSATTGGTGMFVPPLAGVTVPARRRFSEAGLSVNLTPLIGLKGAALEALRQDILGVYGVGPETADSILLYALDGDTFVVDAYTMRIGERHGLFPPGTTYEEAKLIFEGVLGRHVDWFNDYHAQIVALGKHYCKTRNPLCGECPLGAGECFAGGRIFRE